MSRDRFHVFGALRPPGTPSELRERSLAAARAATEVAEPTEAPRESLTDRLWTSRPLRFAWAASVVALLATNLWLDAGARSRTLGRLKVTSVEADARGSGDRDERDSLLTLLESREAVLRAVLGSKPAAAEEEGPALERRRVS